MSVSANLLSPHPISSSSEPKLAPPPKPQGPDPLIADWSREALSPGKYEPGKALLAALRLYDQLKDRTDRIGIARRKWAVLQHRFWSAVCGCEIPLVAQIGGGLVLPHPQGVVINSDAVIGPNCAIMSAVTIGVTREPGFPVIEGGVDIGSGARILGPVRVGAGAQIGANAVVVKDVPAGATAVGIPARILQR